MAESLNPFLKMLSISTSGFGQALPEGEFPATGNFELSFAPMRPASVDGPLAQISAPSVAPNPVRQDTEITFQGPAPLGRELSVVAANGRLVRSLGPVRDGALRWDARNDDGTPVPAGVYFVRVEGTSLQARAVVLR